MFERYAIVDQNDIAAAMKKFQANEQQIEESYSSATVEPDELLVAKGPIVN